MNKQKESTDTDAGAFAEEARALIVATAELAGEKVGEARQHLAAALERGKEIASDVRDKAAQGAKVVDQKVRENPYQAMAIGLGLGFFIGYYAACRCSQNRD
jgi:ElaB/YqjD/DUF883 family membrane-anchored ribosome-binding protein